MTLSECAVGHLPFWLTEEKMQNTVLKFFKSMLIALSRWVKKSIFYIYFFYFSATYPLPSSSKTHFLEKMQIFSKICIFPKILYLQARVHFPYTSFTKIVACCFSVYLCMPASLFWCFFFGPAQPPRRGWASAGGLRSRGGIKFLRGD